MAERKGSFSGFIEEKRGALLHYIRSRVNEIGMRDAEDILQDVLAGFVAIDDSENIEEVSSYIYRSIRNKIIDIYRGSEYSRNIRSLDEEISGDGDSLVGRIRSDPQLLMERGDLMEKILTAVDSLSEDQKAVWIATELEGRNFQELAVLWDEPLGTLLSRKSRATKKLRKILSDEYSAMSEDGKIIGG
jgi:RNA polymerase sigma factor (sigma-70 family)